MSSILIVFITAAMLLLSSCGQRDAQLTVSLGGAPAELDFWDQIIERFEQQSGIKVNFQRQPSDTNQRRQQLVISFRAKQPDPDVFLMDVAWIAQFAASDWLAPLDDYFDDNLQRDDFFQGIIQQADTYNNNILALPVYIDGGLLYYRSDLLQKYGYNDPPRTWQELVEQAQHIQQEMRSENTDFYGYVWQGAQYEGLICNFLEIAASNGGGFLFDNDTLYFDTPQNRESVDFMRDLIARYKVTPEFAYTELKEDEVRIIFQQGNALFERNWPYAWALHQSDDSPVRGKVGITMLSHFPDGESASTLGGWHVGIAQYSDVKEEAWEFVKFILSYDIQKEAALAVGWNPGRKDLYTDSDVLEKLPHFKQLHSVFENAVARPRLPFYSQISEVAQKYIHAVISGNMNSTDALSQAEQQIRKIMDRYETD